MNRGRVLTSSLRALVWLVTLLALSGCGGISAIVGTPQPTAVPFDRNRVLVDVSWIASHQGSDNLRILDVRAKDFYDAGHIPGAVALDLSKTDEASSSPEGYKRLQTKTEQLLGGLGVDNASEILLYDDGLGHGPARLYWLLDWLGHRNVHILNGGLAAWKSASKPVVKEKTPAFPKATFTGTPEADKIVAGDYVLANLKKPGVVILDGRSAPEYKGQLIFSARGGHIPGAVNIDWERDVTTDAPRTLKPPAELLAQFAAVGVTRDKEVILYSQSGARCSMHYLALKLLGFERVRMYSASWAEWGARSDWPVEQETATKPTS